MRLEDRELAVEAEDRGGDDRDVQPDRGVVEQKPRREVVETVDDDVVALDDLHDVGGVEPDGVLDDVDVRVDRGDRLLGGVDLGDADPVRRMDHLALQVREIDLVVVDDADRADPGGGQVERGGRTEPPGPQQEYLGVQQLLLALGTHLGEEQVARVPLTLLGAQRPRNRDLVAAVLPQRVAAGHRLDVLVAEVLDQGTSRPGGAVSGLAVEDNVL